MDAPDVVCRRTLDRLLESSVILGRDYRYQYANDAAVRQGRHPREALIGRTLMEVHPGVEDTALFEAVRRVLAGGPAERCEHLFDSPDGSSGWYDVSIQPAPEGVCLFSISAPDRRLDALRGAGRTVLVVDDDAPIRKAVTAVLAPMGFTVMTALDGADALRWLSGHRTAVNVIVLDLQMPNMDGRTLFGRLRTLMPEVPVIITSGVLSPEEATAWEFGDSPHLAKPFTKADLVRALTTALGSH